MKGYCQCGKVIDEVEFTQFGNCFECSIKYPKLKIVYKNVVKHYICNTVEWNHYLNRYYPKAELILVIEPLNNNKINIMID